MKETAFSELIAADTYCGRILPGDFSDQLKTRLEACCRAFSAFDQIGTDAIPYIAAWHDNQKTIWYEFVSKNFMSLLNCSPETAAETLRKSIIEQKVFQHLDSERKISENILVSEDLRGARTNIRREVHRRGSVEAVYKCLLANERTLWIKDQAFVESYPDDQIHLSIGCLTVVTKEMKADEARRRMARALRESERKFRDQALHDDLTGLYNTRHLFEVLPGLIEAGQCDGEKLSLIFFDIDNFKGVVDTHGHLKASQVIREVGHLLQETLKPPEFGVAYAGDEFIVVIPDCGKARAMEKAEQLRHCLRKNTFLNTAGLAIRLRASFGVATFPDDSKDQMGLLAIADQAMFHIKAIGKNSVGDVDQLLKAPNSPQQKVFDF
jgi:diguanylate cyclase (GGDEF)-like protein